MITNGKNLDFGQSAAGLPNVNQGIIQLFQPVTVGIIKDTQVNGYTQTVVTKYIKTQGVRNQTPNKLVMSKSGERIWDAQEVYFLSGIVLVADDLFLFNKFQFRVLETEDWTEYGYNRYAVIQDYTKIYEVKPVII